MPAPSSGQLCQGGTRRAKEGIVAGNKRNGKRQYRTLYAGRDEHDRMPAISQYNEMGREVRPAAMAAGLAFRTGVGRGITQLCLDAEVVLQRVCERPAEAASSEQDGRGHQDCQKPAENRAHP